MLSALKRVFGRGLALAIPLGVVVYVFMKLVEVFEKLIKPLTEKLGIEKILGELTLTTLAILILILIIFVLGLLMRVSFISRLEKSVDGLVTKLIPTLHQFKVMAAEKLDLDNEVNDWKPVMVLHEEKYFPAFIIEEQDDRITLYVIKGTSIHEDGEILITSKSEVILSEITANDIHRCSKQFGKGYLELIKKSNLKASSINHS